MPRLLNLRCNVKWAETGAALKEYQTFYGDSCVETWLAVPEQEEPCEFFIQLTSDGYIAPGVAMFVYIDGVYQCNRNQRHLVVSSSSKEDKNPHVNLKARQKEIFHQDGSIKGSTWMFSPITNDDKVASAIANQTATGLAFDGKYVGVIEVIVLRCEPEDRAPSPVSIYRLPIRSGAGQAYQLANASDTGIQDQKTFASPASKKHSSQKQAGKLGTFRYKEDGTGTYHPAEQKDKCDNENSKTGGEDSWKDSIRNARDGWGTQSSSSHGEPGQSSSFQFEQLPDPEEIRKNVANAMRVARKEYHCSWSASEPTIQHGETQLLNIGPKEAIKKSAATHVMQLSEPSPYLHKLAKPRYIDSHLRPYAVFRFHYRHDAMLQHVLKISIENGDEVKDLNALSKEELVKRLMKLKKSSHQESDNSWGSTSPNDARSNAWGSSSNDSTPASQAKADEWDNSENDSGLKKSGSHETWDNTKANDTSQQWDSKQDPTQWNGSAEDPRDETNAHTVSGSAPHSPHQNDYHWSSARYNSSNSPRAGGFENDPMDKESMTKYFAWTMDQELYNSDPFPPGLTDEDFKAAFEKPRDKPGCIEQTGVIPKGLDPNENWPSLQEKKIKDWEEGLAERRARMHRSSHAPHSPSSLRGEVLKQQHHHRHRGGSERDFDQRKRGYGNWEVAGSPKAASLPGDRPKRAESTPVVW